MENFSKFYLKSVEDRLEILSKFSNTDKLPSLDLEIGDKLVENYIGNYDLPMGIALNFIVDGKQRLIPMAIEEPSVIAAASNGARILGEFKTTIEKKNIIGHIVLNEIVDLEDSKSKVDEKIDYLMDLARQKTKSMIKRGGGPQNIWTDTFEEDGQKFLTVYFSVNTVDAMGANTINTILESLSSEIEKISGAKSLMRIISNNATESVVVAEAKTSINNLAEDKIEAIRIAKRIEQAALYANLDPYRASTHNKGIMNGIDAVIIATGNDFRAIEAAAHTYASRDGKYKSLTQWKYLEDSEEIYGKIEIPLPVATVGGTISAHPIAKWSLNLMENPSAKELASIIASVGLAQNFAAVRAIVSEGIQKGHMSLHARSLASQVGAKEKEIELVVEKLIQEEKMNSDIAKKILDEIRK